MAIQTPDIKAALKNFGRTFRQNIFNMAGITAIALATTSCIQPILAPPAQSGIPYAETIGSQDVQKYIFDIAKQTFHPDIAKSLDMLDQNLAIEGAVSLRQPILGVNEMYGGQGEAYMAFEISLEDKDLSSVIQRARLAQSLRDGTRVVYQETGILDWQLSYEIVDIDDGRWGVRIFHYGSKSIQDVAGMINGVYDEEVHRQSLYELVLTAPNHPSINPEGTFPLIYLGANSFNFGQYEGDGGIYWYGLDEQGKPTLIKDQ